MMQINKVTTHTLDWWGGGAKVHIRNVPVFDSGLGPVYETHTALLLDALIEPYRAFELEVGEVIDLDYAEVEFAPIAFDANPLTGNERRVYMTILERCEPWINPDESYDRVPWVLAQACGLEVQTLREILDSLVSRGLLKRRSYDGLLSPSSYIPIYKSAWEPLVSTLELAKRLVG